jgi:two-component system sensor histidine kinase BaeS
VRSLQGRLLAAVALLALAEVLGVAVAARHGARRELKNFVAREGKASIDDVAEKLRTWTAAHPRGLAAADLQTATAHLPVGAAALLIDAHGGLLAKLGEPLRRMTVSTRRAGSELVVTMAAADRGLQTVLELHLGGGEVPVRFLGTEGGRAAVSAWLLPLVLPSARARRDSAVALDALDRDLMVVSVAAAVIALFLTWALARRILAPVRQLQQAACDLALGRFASRVLATGPEEIANLGRAFNEMAAELERQQRLRRDLVNDVAHELRAPLTAMLCRLDTAQDGLEADPAAALAGFHGDVLHLVRLVEDLQELALAEAGQLRLNCEQSSLAAIAAAAVRTAGLERDGRVGLEIAPALDVFADPIRLRQVLVNLLTNAARHTPADGRIRVSAAVVDDEVRVEVADSGCGLTGDQLALVFERFYRTDAARRRDTEGRGLGLAIVKAVIEAQRGRVWAESGSGGGARFGFGLPAVPAPHGSLPAYMGTVG